MDAPERWWGSWRKARQPHECEECRGTIRKGERYLDARSLHEGEFYHYRLCRPCNELGEAVASVDGAYVAGEIRETAAELITELSEQRDTYKRRLTQLQAMRSLRPVSTAAEEVNP